MPWETNIVLDIKSKQAFEELLEQELNKKIHALSEKQKKIVDIANNEFENRLEWGEGIDSNFVTGVCDKINAAAINLSKEQEEKIQKLTYVRDKSNLELNLKLAIAKGLNENDIDEILNIYASAYSEVADPSDKLHNFLKQQLENGDGLEKWKEKKLEIAKAILSEPKHRSNTDLLQFALTQIGHSLNNGDLVTAVSNETITVQEAYVIKDIETLTSTKVDSTAYRVTLQNAKDHVQNLKDYAQTYPHLYAYLHQTFVSDIDQSVTKEHLGAQEGLIKGLLKAYDPDVNRRKKFFADVVRPEYKEFEKLAKEKNLRYVWVTNSVSEKVVSEIADAAGHDKKQVYCAKVPMTKWSGFNSFIENFPEEIKAKLNVLNGSSYDQNYTENREKALTLAASFLLYKKIEEILINKNINEGDKKILKDYLGIDVGLGALNNETNDRLSIEQKSLKSIANNQIGNKKVDIAKLNITSSSIDSLLSDLANLATPQKIDRVKQVKEAWTDRDGSLLFADDDPDNILAISGSFPSATTCLIKRDAPVFGLAKVQQNLDSVPNQATQVVSKENKKPFELDSRMKQEIERILKAAGYRKGNDNQWVYKKTLDKSASEKSLDYQKKHEKLGELADVLNGKKNVQDQKSLMGIVDELENASKGYDARSKIFGIIDRTSNTSKATKDFKDRLNSLTELPKTLEVEQTNDQTQSKNPQSYT